MLLLLGGALSLLLQLGTIYYALALVPVTGKKSPWILLSAGIITMAIRRLITLFDLLAGSDLTHELAFELVGLFGSAVMLAGVCFIRPIFLSINKSKQDTARSEKKLRDITSYLGEGIYVLDAQGKITFMNPEAERLLGWTQEEMNEAGPHKLVHKQKSDGLPHPPEECKMFNVMKTGVRYASTEEVFTRKDGVIFPISVITTPIVEDGKMVSAVTAFRDITAEKKMETEVLKMQKLESLGILAGGIAHDFNNLLQAILGNISLARLYLSTNTHEKLPDFLEKAETAVETAKALSFRLLTFAKGGAPIRMTLAIENILRKSVSLSLSGSDIGCDMVLPADLHPVNIDEGQMAQVFNNILINAREAMPQGGTIKIKAENVAISASDNLPLQDGDYVRVSIQDSGIGIAEENLAKIFDPYYSTKHKHGQKGSGLGLSICLSIIKKHEGHISVESQQGAGATFHVYLAAAHGLPARQESVTAAPQPQEARKLRLLFMDDDEMIRGFVAQLMTHLGHEAAFARNGEEAIELYRKAGQAGEGFDAVILDLTVQGGMGGEMAVRELRKLDPRVKAAISSGYADSAVIRDFAGYGFVGAITKPFNIEELRTLLRKFQ